MLIVNHDPSVTGPHISMRGEVLEVRAQPDDVEPLLSLYLELPEHQVLCRVAHEGLRKREYQRNGSPQVSPSSEHPSWCEEGAPHDPDECATALVQVGTYDDYAFMTLDHRTNDPVVMLTTGHFCQVMSPPEASQFADLIEQHGADVAAELRRLAGLVESVPT